MESIPKQAENTTERKIMPEVAKKLFLFSNKENNPVNFYNKEYGENLDLNNLNIKKEINDEIREKDLEDLLKVFLKGFKQYLNGPIFLDTFSVFHDNRRKWENAVKDEMSPDVLEYYNNNRLNINKISGVIKGLELFIENLKESNIKNNLKQLLVEINTSFPEFQIMPNKKSLDYHSLDDIKKIEIVQKFSKKIQEIIEIVEEKPKNLTETKQEVILGTE